MKKKGISLIVLVITIIVIIVLSTAVIVTFVLNNPISKSKEAVDKWNDKTNKEEILLAEIDWQTNFDAKKEYYLSKPEFQKNVNGNGQLTDYNLLRLYTQIRKDMYNEDNTNATIKNSYLAAKKALQLYGYNSIFEIDTSNDIESIESGSDLETSNFSFDYSIMIVDGEDAGTTYMQDSNGKKYVPVDRDSMNEIIPFFPGEVIPEATGTAVVTDYYYTALSYAISFEQKNEKATSALLKVKEKETYTIVDPFSNNNNTISSEPGQVAWILKTDENGEAVNWGFLMCNIYIYDIQNFKFYYINDNGNCLENLPF